MAHMHPSQLPDAVLQNRKLRGEIAVFEALARLPDEFEVFYNRCASKGNAARAYDRPIDFIIIHERLGLLGMEVKGGKIRIGADGGFEQFIYKFENWKPVNPFGQVKMALRMLIETCKQDGANYWIPDDCCVVFPGTARAQLTDKPHMLPAGTLCADDLGLFPNLIQQLFSANKGRAAWSSDAFIDMRRRLQNMPEARRGFSPASPSKIIERIFKAKPAPEEQQTGRIVEEVEDSSDDFEEDLPSIAYIRPKPPVYPSIAAPFMPERPRQKLKWWEIAVVMLAAGLTFIFVLWLFGRF